MGKRCSLLAVMRDKHDRGGAFAPRPNHKLPTARCHGRVKGDEGLVEQYEFGLDREGASNRHATCHAKRQGSGKSVAKRREVERLKQMTGQIGVPAGLNQKQVLAHGAPRQQTWLLKNRADARHGTAAPVEFTGEIGIKAADDPQQSALTAARWPDDSNDLALAEGKVDASKHRQITIV